MNSDGQQTASGAGAQDPPRGKNLGGIPASAFRQVAGFVRQPWVKWFTFFTVLVIVIVWIAWQAPPVRALWYGVLVDGGPTPAAGASAAEGLAPLLPQVPRPGVDPFISRAIIPANPTEPADNRREVIAYTVQKGDYLFGIAEKFAITPETVLWSNYTVLKDNPDFLSPGQVLSILPVNGLYYQWRSGDRLDTVAGAYGVKPEDIILWPGNGLDPTVDIQNPGIPPGTWLVVPGGHREFKLWEIPVIRKTDHTPWVAGGDGACQGPFSGPAGTGYWGWPTSSKWVCGNDYSSFHHGIDLYITMDEPIRAADRGVVVYAGWNTWGYGNLVVVDHGNDWQTVYAHLDEVDVFCGAIVNRGETIGLGGTTGNSTGPHLHFEMIFSGVRVNPHDYLF